jgi:hypothetical protein
MGGVVNAAVKPIVDGLISLGQGFLDAFQTASAGAQSRGGGPLEAVIETFAQLAFAASLYLIAAVIVMLLTCFDVLLAPFRPIVEAVADILDTIGTIVLAIFVAGATVDILSEGEKMGPAPGGATADAAFYTDVGFTISELISIAGIKVGSLLFGKNILSKDLWSDTVNWMIMFVVWVSITLVAGAIKKSSNEVGTAFQIFADVLIYFYVLALYVGETADAKALKKEQGEAFPVVRVFNRLIRLADLIMPPVNLIDETAALLKMHP